MYVDSHGKEGVPLLEGVPLIENLRYKAKNSGLSISHVRRQGLGKTAKPEGGKFLEGSGTSRLSFKQVPGLTVDQEICSGLKNALLK